MALEKGATLTELIRRLLIASGHPRFWYWWWVLSLSGLSCLFLGIVYPGTPGMIFSGITGGVWAGLGVWDQDRFLRRPEIICACCTFGNHDMRCSCDGSDCCCPEAYLDYNPEWGHGTRDV